MDYVQGQYRIISKKNLAKNVFDFTIDAKDIAKSAVAGQFIHIKVDGFMLRRPISICEVDKENGIIRFVFEIKGEGTEKLSQFNKGDNLDVIGPLGKGFTMLEPNKKVVLVGGGIGVPPMVEVAKNYGKNATVIIGFRSSNCVILDNDFKDMGVDLRICTDDGTMGIKGYVDKALKERLKQDKVDMIKACGPHMMLKSIVSLANEYGVDCQVSLEERMACGVGACLVCACKTIKNGKEYLSHICKDGPVFNAQDIVL